jgi:hypothetical protein
MTGPDIIKSPVRVDKEGERLYFYVPHEVCVELTSGRPEDRARVLALVGQAQQMALDMTWVLEQFGHALPEEAYARIAATLLLAQVRHG